jgi:3-oxoacyl-[acyl-carrier-protein] synthase II
MKPTIGRPVISAWSVVSPLGVGASEFAAGLRSGRRATSTLDQQLWSAPMGQACLVPDFDIREVLGRRGTRSMDRVTGLAVAAVEQLLAGSKGGATASEDIALVLGTSTGSVQSIMDFTRDSLVGDKPFFVDPARFPNTVMNCAAGQCAIWHGLKGPNTTIAGGRAAGLLALQYALRLQRSRHADSVLCGAVEEFSTARAWLELHSRAGDGADVVLGEGCAVVRLELAGPDDEGPQGIAEVLRLEFAVYHRDGDLHPVLVDCVQRALVRAGVEAADVGLISCSGAPGARGEHERAAVAEIFAGHQPQEVRCAELIGETSAASAAFQLIAVLATAGDAPELRGATTLITSVDHDGVIGCALVRLL